MDILSTIPLHNRFKWKRRDFWPVNSFLLNVISTWITSFLRILIEFITSLLSVAVKWLFLMRTQLITVLNHHQLSNFSLNPTNNRSLYNYINLTFIWDQLIATRSVYHDWTNLMTRKCLNFHHTSICHWTFFQLQSNYAWNCIKIHLLKYSAMSFEAKMKNFMRYWKNFSNQ